MEFTTPTLHELFCHADEGWDSTDRPMRPKVGRRRADYSYIPLAGQAEQGRGARHGCLHDELVRLGGSRKGCLFTFSTTTYYPKLQRGREDWKSDAGVGLAREWEYWACSGGPPVYVCRG